MRTGPPQSRGLNQHHVRLSLRKCELATLQIQGGEPWDFTVINELAGEYNLESISNTMGHLSFIVGYSQLIPSRKFRRLVAGTDIHRCWLSGNIGCIGEPEGVLYRRWYTNRKAHKNASIKQVWICLRGYYGLDQKKCSSLIAAIIRDVIERQAQASASD